MRSATTSLALLPALALAGSLNVEADVDVQVGDLSVGAQLTVQGSCNGAGPVEKDDFVTVDGTRLVDSKGELHYVAGINYWSCMNLAASADAGGNHSRFITELDQMAAAGINHLRLMASSEGAPTIQPNRMYPALMPSPYHWDEDIFVGLDECIAEMGKRGMRATMTLQNTWNWSGGMGQMVSWTKDNETIPYPPSWSPEEEPQPWGNYTTNGTWDGYTDYATSFYTNAAAQDIYRAHILQVINRVNTVTGVAYKDDAAVMTWELANEPQPVDPDTEDPADALLAWIDETSKFIKEAAPKQLVTAGMESKHGEWWFKRFHEPEGIDYATSHMWVQNWGYYDMLDKSPENLQGAIDFATGFLANTSQWALDIEKPILLEEFGMARDNWKSNQQALEDNNATYVYASWVSTDNKDTYFKHAFDTVLGYFKADEAYVGTAPWAYGGIWRPEPLYRNEFNEAWAGDPAHEAPGWYDIYDTDEALQLILEQSKNATAWIASN